jgi:hypothetical protein
MISANIKIVLCLSVPVNGKNLAEGLSSAHDVKVCDLIKIKPHVSHNDSSIKVTGIDTGEWTE